MRHVLVRYTVRPDQAEENARLITEVFTSLRRSAPPGLTYASYRMDDGVSFMHVASVENPDANPLLQLAEFKAFTAGIRDRCDVPPVTTVLYQIGSYAPGSAPVAV
jgi:hypothetical protein